MGGIVINTLLTPGGMVLRPDGSPVPGYSVRSTAAFRRDDIKASPWRIKEWDFYQITDDRMCLQFTFGHASYAGQIGIMLFDYRKGEMLATPGRFLVLPFNSLHMPENAERDQILCWGSGDRLMKFEVQGDERRLLCRWDDFTASIVLRRQTPNSLVINIPFDESPTRFYYNQKINCMSAEGDVRWGENQSYHFDPADAYGLLDWGRGVWPFHNEWYWSNGAGRIGDKLFGFNLGCGFGNNSVATENILFYGDTVHKLGAVRIEPDQTDYMRPWRLRDEKGRLDLTLAPSYDRTTRTKLLWVNNVCHQVFGDFSGTAVLDDQTVLKIDRIPSFAEHAVNNW